MFRSIARATLQSVVSNAKSLIVIGLLIFAPNAKAVEIPHAWLGGHYGLSVPNASNSSSRPMLGFSVGAKIGTEIGLSGYYFGSHKDEAANTPFDYDLYGIQLSYHFEGEADGAFFGVRLGTSKLKSGLSSESSSNYGIVGGYDYMFTDHLSIGGEASFMSVPAAGAISGFTTLNFLGSLKIWL